MPTPFHARPRAQRVRAERAAPPVRRALAGRQGKRCRCGGRAECARPRRQVQRALLDMSTDRTDQRQPEAGQRLLGEIGKVGKLHKPRVEQASFAVLKAPDIPSVLVETAFISNPTEGAPEKRRIPGTAGRRADAGHPALFLPTRRWRLASRSRRLAAKGFPLARRRLRVTLGANHPSRSLSHETPQRPGRDVPAH